MREALARSERDFLMSDDAQEMPSRLIAALKLILNRPIEVAGVLAMGAVGVAIVFNALAFQSGVHPAPFFAQQQRQLAAAQRRAPQTIPSAANPAVGSDAGAGDDTTAALSDQAALVRDLQVELSEASLYDGTADGLFGPKTAAAIRAYQGRTGLVADGQPTLALLNRIRSVPLPVSRPAPLDQPARTDAIGALIEASVAPAPASDARTLRIERALNALGYGPLKVDGVVDAKTKAAIGQFEVFRTMPVTGKVSARLERELGAVLGAPLE